MDAQSELGCQGLRSGGSKQARSDVLAPVGGQSLLRDRCQSHTSRAQSAEESQSVIGQRFGRATWVARAVGLGKVLPRQREGAAQWFQELKSTLKRGGLELCGTTDTLERRRCHLACSRR